MDVFHQMFFFLYITFYSYLFNAPGTIHRMYAYATFSISWFMCISSHKTKNIQLMKHVLFLSL